MSKCIIFILCATFVAASSVTGYANIREKRAPQNDWRTYKHKITSNLSDTNNRQRRQSWQTNSWNNESQSNSMATDNQNYYAAANQIGQQPAQEGLTSYDKESVQRSNYYEDRSGQSFSDSSASYHRKPPPPPLPDERYNSQYENRPPPPPPRSDYQSFDRGAPSYDRGPPPRHDRWDDRPPPPPPPSRYYEGKPPHDRGPPPRDYYAHYDRRPPPPPPPPPHDKPPDYYERRYERDDQWGHHRDHAYYRRSGYDRDPPPPPPDRPPPYGRGPPQRDWDPPRHHHHDGPPPSDRHGGPPPHPPPRHGGPPPRDWGPPPHNRESPPHHHPGGPPPRNGGLPPDHYGKPPPPPPPPPPPTPYYREPLRDQYHGLSPHDHEEHYTITPNNPSNQESRAFNDSSGPLYEKLSLLSDYSDLNSKNSSFLLPYDQKLSSLQRDNIDIRSVTEMTFDIDTRNGFNANNNNDVISQDLYKSHYPPLFQVIPVTPEN